MITTAKGLTSGYAPLGAVILDERLMEPFRKDGTVLMHGTTYGGHPVSCAVAPANLDVIERENIYGHVLSEQDAFKSALDKLRGLPNGSSRGTCPPRCSTTACTAVPNRSSSSLRR